jgi:hypothetical protein
MVGQVVKTYGRGSWLAFLAPLFSFLIARQGMHGWELSAAEDMQRDALAMRAKGYHVAWAEEYRLALLGVAWFRVVYEKMDQPARTDGTS